SRSTLFQARHGGHPHRHLRVYSYTPMVDRPSKIYLFLSTPADQRQPFIRKTFWNVAFSGVNRKFATDVLPLFVLKVVTKVSEVSGSAGKDEVGCTSRTYLVDVGQRPPKLARLVLYEVSLDIIIRIERNSPRVSEFRVGILGI